MRALAFLGAAAMSRSRLWQRQGRRAEAHEVLAPTSGWCTEGFNTADLQEAQARRRPYYNPGRAAVLLARGRITCAGPRHSW